MLQSIMDLMNGVVTAADGEFGRITDVLFDDEEKSIRFVVVETAEWLADRHVVIPYDVLQFSMRKNGLQFPFARKEVLNRWVRATLGGPRPSAARS